MDSVINLDNGDKLVVSNSAPFIKLFIKKAIELGYEFEAIEKYG
jgi:hypothetical protein